MTEPENTAAESHLSEAVEKTEGLQPWRRLFHATNGTLVVVALALLGLSRPTALLILGIILGVLAIMDLVRLLDPTVNVLFFRTFSSLASPREQKKIASSTWYAASLLLVLLLFPLAYALAGILVLAWADPAANVIGQKTGRRPFLAGTVRGTATFVLVAFCASVFFVPWWMALVAATVTGLVEAAPLELDDNLIVPVTAASLLYLMGLLI
jgi:dolichol kinase